MSTIDLTRNVLFGPGPADLGVSILCRGVGARFGAENRPAPAEARLKFGGGSVRPGALVTVSGVLWTRPRSRRPGGRG
jgi:hypothetical protein